jgi:hypothetical protein
VSAVRTRLAGLALVVLAGCGERGGPTTGAGGAARSGPSAAEAREATAKRLGLPPEFRNDLGMRFVLVPPGLYAMGSPESDPARGPDETPHDVEIFGAFYVQAEETPAAAYASFRDGAAATGPARAVSYADATDFAEWLSRRDATWNYRLPTEAEWEYAARTGGDAVRETTGAAWEWCSDWYGEYPDWQEMNPAGPRGGDERVLRGGDARVAKRRHAPPEARSPEVGVRLVAPLPYAKADLGSCTITFRAIDTDAGGREVAEHPGLEVRFISVFDRLSSRQTLKPELPWTVIAAKRTPFTWHVPPGRYYAQTQVPGDESQRGIEMKIYLDPGTTDPVQTVNLPTPKKGALLAKPQ